MLVVNIELHSAITGKTTVIGRMVIANDGTGTANRGNYFVRLLRRGSTSKVIRTGEVKDHARQAYSVWALVAKSLRSVGY